MRREQEAVKDKPKHARCAVTFVRGEGRQRETETDMEKVWRLWGCTMNVQRPPCDLKPGVGQQVEEDMTKVLRLTRRSWTPEDERQRQGVKPRKQSNKHSLSPHPFSVASPLEISSSSSSSFFTSRRSSVFACWARERASFLASELYAKQGKMAQRIPDAYGNICVWERRMNWWIHSRAVCWITSQSSLASAVERGVDRDHTPSRASPRCHLCTEITNVKCSSIVKSSNPSNHLYFLSKSNYTLQWQRTEH